MRPGKDSNFNRLITVLYPTLFQHLWSLRVIALYNYVYDYDYDSWYC